MEVVIDGIIFQLQSHGGISRLHSEILPRMCSMDDSLQMTLFTNGKFRQKLPAHQHITHRHIPQVELFLRPGRIWKPVVQIAKQLIRQLWIGSGKGKLWHSTYYTLQEKWIGRSIVTVVDMIPERFPILFKGSNFDKLREQKRLCVLNADAVICISETTRQDIKHFFRLDLNSIYVVHLACSEIFKQLEQSEIKAELLPRQPFLLYVGVRVHYKNFDALIQAYSVWSRRKDVDLVIVGRSWSTNEEKCLVSAGIQDQVHLLTDIDDETLCHLYNKASAFVYPSFYEGFGIPLLEAMACGCPVIASRIPSTIEVAGECPVYFDPIDLDTMLNAFEIALSEGRNSERVQNGLERVKRYSWDRAAQQMLEVYRSLS